jgi:hypothetical protein
MECRGVLVLSGLKSSEFIGKYYLNYGLLNNIIETSTMINAPSFQNSSDQH